MIKTKPILGMDGCTHGWVVCKIYQNRMSFYFTDNPFVFLNVQPPSSLIIDIPMILPKSIQDYPRKADIAAKKILGKNHSSIFYAPLKSWLNQDLQTVNRQCSQYNKPKLSIQSFNLFKPIKSAQSIRTISHIDWRESHPELFFRWFSCSPLQSKKTTQGIHQRLSISIDLIQLFGIDLNLSHLFAFLNHYKKQVKLDDIIDALAMALCGIIPKYNLKELPYIPHKFKA